MPDCPTNLDCLVVQGLTDLRHLHGVGEGHRAHLGVEEGQGGVLLGVGQHQSQARGGDDWGQDLGAVNPAVHELLVDVHRQEVALVGLLHVVLSTGETFDRFLPQINTEITLQRHA